MQSEKELGADMHEAVLQEILTEVQGYCHHNSPASVLDIYSKEMLFWALDGMLSRERALKRALRGRPVSVEEARESVRRLINSHFHNANSARCSIPAQASDDDLVASDYIEESAKRLQAAEAEYAKMREAYEQCDKRNEELARHLEDVKAENDAENWRLTADAQRLYEALKELLPYVCGMSNGHCGTKLHDRCHAAIAAHEEARKELV